MFVDASALTAILAEESDAALFAGRLAGQARCITSALAVWETTVAIARILGLEPEEALEKVEQFLALARIEVREIPAVARFAAVEAFARYGKGRHPASLNMGDCFSYACAKTTGDKLMFKGDDFAQTDILRA